MTQRFGARKMSGTASGSNQLKSQAYFIHGGTYMCGIVGYTGTQNAAPILLEGLKKLEYRGYDSAGIAVLNDGRISISKVTGRIAGLAEKKIGRASCRERV